MNLYWLALTAFAIGTEAFVITGLLPIIAADIDISIADTGLLVTVYALTYAVGSPILAVVFNNIDRKRAMVLALVFFVAGNLAAAAANGLAMLLVARMVMAVAAGLAIPTANAVAIALAPPEKRGRAIAVVSSGMTVSTVLGVPLGTMVGDSFGWHATFLLVALLGVMALAGLVFGLPRGLPRSAATLAQRLAVARNGAVLRTLAATTVWAASIFTVFTYIAVALHDVGMAASGVSFALLVFGIAAAIGNTAGGRLVDRFGSRPVAGIALALLTVALAAESFTLKMAPPEIAAPAMVLLLFLWGLGGWAFYVAQVVTLVRLSPEAPMIALSLNASAMYLGIGLGGMIGGTLLAALGTTDLGWVGACGLALALALTLWRKTVATP
ncbi:MFS transporter [Reyranella sp.]|uniref:MFS transporter n=1 Tax=Reyranella sp. TaxID=1929291 RepID=UPI003C7D33C9